MTRPHFPAVDPDTKLPSAAVQAAWQTNFIDPAVASSFATVATTKVDKDTLVFNVKDFGAVGNGTTDDSAAVQAAIAAAHSVLGGTVFFPRGSFAISGAPLLLYGGVNIRGSGKQGTYLLNKHATGLFTINATCYNNTFADFGVVSSAGAGHVWSITGQVAVGWNVHDIYVDNRLTPAASVVNSDGMLDCVWGGLYWDYTDRSVPMFNLASTAGNASGNVVKDARLTDHGTPTTHVISISETTAWATNNTIQNINFEKCVAGVINASQHQLLTIDSLVLWDLAGSHVSSIATNGTIWTVTFASAHELVVGAKFNLSGYTPSGYNGTHTVASVSSPTVVTVTNATQPGTITVTGQQQRVISNHMIHLDRTNLPNYNTKITRITRQSGVLDTGKFDVAVVASGENERNLYMSGLLGGSSGNFVVSSNSAKGFQAENCYFTTVNQYTNTVAAGAGAGSGATTTTNGGGNRYDGVITVNTGTSTTSGAVATVTQPNGTSFITVPTVVISPMDATTAAAGLYISAVTTNSFTVSVVTALPASTSGLKFSYHLDRNVTT